MTPLDRAACLVLGGGGFIGTHLCRALSARGARVTGFGRRQSFPEELRTIPFVTADFSNQNALTRAVEGHDYVFHLLGGVRPDTSNRNPMGDLSESTLATLSMLEICRVCKTPRIVFVSSGGTVYGVPMRVPIPEDAATDPICAYGVSKLAVEKYLGVYHHLYGLSHVTLRLSNPFGPWQSPGRGQGLIPELLSRALRGDALEIWGDGKVVRDFIYIDDAVEALLAAATYSGAHRVFNVGSGVGRSVREVVADTLRLVGRPHLEVVHKAARASDVPTNILDIKRIRAELEWQPRVTWGEGLLRTTEWLRSAMPV